MRDRGSLYNDCSARFREQFFSFVHKINTFYKMHLLRRMGKCNGGVNERTRECEIARIRAL